MFLDREIEADAYELMKQASDTAHNYMLAAKNAIDSQFGEGYAANHPELVGAFMQTAAKDFHMSMICKVMKNIALAFHREMH